MSKPVVSARLDRPPLSAARRWAALGVLVLSVLLLAVDGTVLYLAVPALTADLGPTATQILWIGDIYSLALAGLLVVMGNLSDRLGRKRLLLIGSGAFGLASLLAAFASSGAVLIVARLLLGIAGATIMPATLSIIRDMFREQAERTRAIAIWSAASAGGAALGPVIGGALLNHFWWGSVFLINFPITLLLIGAGAVLLPESRDPEPGRFDLISAVLSLGAIIPVVWAVKRAVTAGFDLGVAFAFALGLGIGWLFVRRQTRLTNPLLDVELFRQRAFSGAILSNFASVFALTGMLFFFSQYLQLARGFTPLQAGLSELPATVGGLGGIALIGLLMTRLGPGRTTAVALATSAIGLALVSLAEGAEHFIWLALAITCVGLGVGIVQTVTNDSVVSAVSPNKAGTAAATSETAYELGMAFGVALLGSVVTAFYRASVPIPADLPQTHQSALYDSLAAALHTLTPDSPAAEAARTAFTTAMQSTALIAAAITAIAAVIAWLTIPSPRPQP
ncbi:MFS transporter [Nocardia panacis]|uniref:MFS transporter n=1 Tax=Nocardia panacis TaxID=2340916 RepID=A0A3A4K4B7_9NOCA|nr:MFS transporter [Nocardia panacis]RJO69084.1 MFS transporter [Nocardia panacis]